MSSLVALSTRDAVVMGCDSLATATRLMVDPFDLFEYFNGSELAVSDTDERPVLRNFGQILERASNIPFDHMTHVDKLFHLKPLKMGVMFTGVTSIGDRTVKSLIMEFRAKDQAFDESVTNYTVKSVADRLLDFLKEFDDKRLEDSPFARPSQLELILAGYNKSGPHPDVVKISLGDREVVSQERLGPMFGGQTREIERIVYGIDFATFSRLEARHHEALQEYALATLKANGVASPNLPKLSQDHRLFDGSFSLAGLGATWDDFSDQNAIDCVSYFIRIMSQAQRFSSRMPTVGGEMSVALIDQESGFRWVSRREYAHEDHRIERT